MPFGLLLAIAIGGALGSVARHYVSTGVYHVTGPAFPFGILAVNVIGGLVMGIVVELGALKLNYSPEIRAFLTTGVLARYRAPDRTGRLAGQRGLCRGLGGAVCRRAVRRPLAGARLRMSTTAEVHEEEA